MADDLNYFFRLWFFDFDFRGEGGRHPFCLRLRLALSTVQYRYRINCAAYEEALVCNSLDCDEV